MTHPVDLSVIVPALREGPNLAPLLPEIRHVLDSLAICHETIVVTRQPDHQTQEAVVQSGGKLLEQSAPGYGGALLTGFAMASGTYLLTMDADLSHPPDLIRELWLHRHEAEITIASRYVPGGSASMSPTRYFLSRVLNALFRRGLDLPFRDMSSGFRLYKASVVRGESFFAQNFAILPEILVRGWAQGWKVQEVPFKYAPRKHGGSKARLIRFGIEYLKDFYLLWRVRNSVESADYDDRAYDSRNLLQRYLQRLRLRNLTELIAGQGPVLYVGCGSSRIIGSLPSSSVGLDLRLGKLRYARKFSKHLVQGSGCALPFPDRSFPCVVYLQIIESVPKHLRILDELCRVVAPGGRLVVGTPDYERWEWVIADKLYGLVTPGEHIHERVSHYTRRELFALFEERGCALEETRSILGRESILAFIKGRPE